jgi:hypothetical protein
VRVRSMLLSRFKGVQPGKEIVTLCNRGLTHFFWSE